MSRGAYHALLAISALPLLFGCGEDESAPAAPLVPPTLRIDELKSTADSWIPGDEPAELRLGCDPQRVAGVVVGPSTKTAGRLDDFALKPPGACAEPQCGSLVFSLEAGSESRRVRAFSIFAQAELGALALDQTFTLRVALEDSKNQPFTVGGAPVTAEYHIMLRSPEGCDSDGGPSGPEDAGLDAADERADSSEMDASDEGSSDAAGDGEGDGSSPDAGSSEAGDLDGGGD